MSKRVISSTKNNIINIDLSYNKTILILSYEESSVYKSPFESMLSEICSQSIISGSWSLFQPYSGLFNLYTSFGLWGLTKPFSCSIYTSSCNIPFKKALLTSIWYNLKFKWLAIAKSILMDSNLATGAKVYWSQPLPLVCNLEQQV